MELDIQ